MINYQYSQVAEQLRTGILSGQLAPGMRLPTERELCTEYGVSRITIRQALSLLEDEQLITRRQGSGTYVRQCPVRRIPLMIDFTGSVRDHAPALSRQLLLERTCTVPDSIADELRAPQDTEILYAERIDRLGSTIIAWDKVYIRKRYATALTPEALQRVDFIEAWRDVQQLELTACRQRVQAVCATAIDTRRLGVEAGAPLLKAIDIYDVSRDKPIGLFVSHYHPEHITIASRFDYGGTQP